MGKPRNPPRWSAFASVLACSALIGACAGDPPPQDAQAAAQGPELHDQLDARARHQSEYGR